MQPRQPDQEEGQGLAQDEFDGPDRGHHDLLKRPHLALTHDGKGREVDDERQRQVPITPGTKNQRLLVSSLYQGRCSSVTGACRGKAAAGAVEEIDA